MEGRKQCLEDQCKEQVLPKEIAPNTGARGRIHGQAGEIPVYRYFRE
jgi:hypothetical protein